MPTNAQLKAVADALEAQDEVRTGNRSEAGWWRRIALAAEGASGSTSEANDTVEGWMLRAAVALEGAFGGSGAEENRTREGLLKRIVDAMELNAGAGTGSLANRLAGAASAVTFGPALLLTFDDGSPLDPLVTFTRASTGTYSDNAGVTQTAAIDAARFDHNPVTLAPLGLLIEEQRTNLLLRSQEFNNASWTKTNCTVGANARTSPDGTANADAIIPSAGSVSVAIQQAATIVAAAPYTYSVYVENGTLGSNWIEITAWDAVTFRRAWFNLATGAKGASLGSPGAWNITAVGGGRYRVDIITTLSGGTTMTCYISPRPANSSLGNVTGDGASPAFYAYGAQLEAGAFATSYIPTVAATVARSADVAKFTPPAGVDLIEYTFDDDTTAQVAVTPEAEYTIPTNLARARIKSIVSVE